MILKDALVMGANLLAKAGKEGGARDARLLLAEAAGISISRVSVDPDLPLSDKAVAQFEGFLQRRLSHEPVSKILGRRAFYEGEFLVTADVLDPRPETECLIAAALEGPAAARFLDLGTGSGAIAISLLMQWREAQGVASDVSPDCLTVAHLNANSHGVASRLVLLQSDWFENVTGVFDLIVSNPPYISDDEMTTLAPEVALFDPHLALTPGGDGLSPYRSIAKGARLALAAKGRLLVEIGARQGPDVAAIFTKAGFENVAILPDLDGRDRIVIGHQT